jgi:ribonucleotide reductase beta subunit family protein with ferritin-like domain
MTLIQFELRMIIELNLGKNNVINSILSAKLGNFSSDHSSVRIYIHRVINIGSASAILIYCYQYMLSSLVNNKAVESFFKVESEEEKNVTRNSKVTKFMGVQSRKLHHEAFNSEKRTCHTKAYPRENDFI